MTKTAEKRRAPSVQSLDTASVQPTGMAASVQSLDMAVAQPIAHLDAPAPIQQYLASTLGQIEQISGEPAALWQVCTRGLQMETAYRILSGFALVKLRETLPSREFATGLAERHIPRSSAYMAIDAWQMFSALPDVDSVRALAHVGVTKALALRHLSPQEHRALADGDEVRGLKLDQVAEMSARELQQQQREWQLQHDDTVQKLERDVARLRTELDTANNMRKTLARANAALQSEEDLPPFALTVRQEFMALTESMSFGLDNLQAIATEHLFSEVKHPEAEKYQPVAASTAYFALAAIHARAQGLLDRLRDHYQDALGSVTLDTQLTPGEVKRHIEQREQLLAMHNAAAKARDDARENNRPGKRGAKRKASGDRS